jgi:hypothetical protein
MKTFPGHTVGVAGDSSRSWETCILWSLCSCASIHGTHLAQTLTYQHRFQWTAQSSLVIICRSAWMSWSRHSSFHELIDVQDRPEHSLSLTSLSPLLECTTHRFTVFTSTIWSP